MIDAAMRELEGRIHYRFSKPDLLKEALTHRSWSAEHAGSHMDNQRLEFLGDAVIQIIITERIYTQYPQIQEGHMTKMRAVLTRQPSLARLARHIDLGSYLRLGHGEEKNQGAERPSNLCDAFEALLGAIFLDTDCTLGAASPLLNRLIDEVFPNPFQALSDENPKGALQEWAQKALAIKPDYRTLNVTGPDHERCFDVAVYVGDARLGVGRAGKRQTAEQEAARDALTRLDDADNDHATLIAGLLSGDIPEPTLTPDARASK